MRSGPPSCKCAHAGKWGRPVIHLPDRIAATRHCPLTCGLALPTYFPALYSNYTRFPRDEFKLQSSSPAMSFEMHPNGCCCFNSVYGHACTVPVLWPSGWQGTVLQRGCGAPESRRAQRRNRMRHCKRWRRGTTYSQQAGSSNQLLDPAC